MKLLIITSERLNPGYLLGSSFELTQAAILSRALEVVILSVEVETSLSAELKRLVKARGSGNRPPTSPLRILRSLLKRRAIVNEYIINGIDVIEGTGFYWRSPRTFLGSLPTWVNSGSDAFETYSKKYGQPDLIHAHGRFLTAGALALQLKKKYGIRYVYTEHSSYFHRGMVPDNTIPILREIITGAAAYMTVSKAVLGHVESVMQTKLPQAITVPNALDTIFEAPLNDRPPHKEFVFTVVASLEQNKGIDILIEAFKTAIGIESRLRLNICGEGSRRAEIEEQIAAASLTTTVRLVGGKSKEGVRELLDDSDAFVLSSRGETFGVVIIEALSRGLPVVTTRSGGPEYLVNDGNGIVVPLEDADALAAALVEIARGYDRFDRFKIRQDALSGFASDHFLTTMQKIYNEAIKV